MNSKLQLAALLCALLCLVGASKGERVAIVGAGIGGCASAYFLRQDVGDGIELTVVERQSHVGGRVSPIQLGDDVFEAGASIAVDANEYLTHFAEDVAGLERGKPVMGRLGIWDGQEMVFQESGWKVLDIVASLWRYGRELLSLRREVGVAAANFAELYELQRRREAFAHPKQLLQAVHLWNLTQVQLSEYLEAAGVVGANSRVLRELGDAVTRINYMQSSKTMNAMAGLVGLAPLAVGGVWQVPGAGNVRMLQALLQASGAKVVTDTKVVRVVQESSERGGGWRLQLGDDSFLGGTFDRVVIAHPMHLSGLTVQPNSGAKVQSLPSPATAFQRVHATFVRGVLRPSYFGVAAADGGELPAEILTTASEELPFCSIGLQKRGVDGALPVYKVFSKTGLSADTLDALFERHEEHVERVWEAYPRFKPPEQFMPFELVKDSVYYVNALERGASAMEVLAVAARNVALLIAHGRVEDGNGVGAAEKKSEL